MKDTHKAKVLAITGMASMAFVMPNVAADVEGHVVSEDGLIALIEAVEKGEAAIVSLADAQTNLATAKTDLATATASLATAQTDLQTQKDKVAELTTKVTRLEAQDGSKFSNASAQNDADGNAKTKFLCDVDAEAKKLRGE